MKSTTRRDLLKGLACGSLIIGFDPLTRSWVTSAHAGSKPNLEHVPHLDGVLRTDEEALTAAAQDNGRIIERRPIAVLEPGSVHDVARIVRFANKQGLRVAVRGHGHLIPDYLELSVGGTLSIGGISPTTYRYGAQVDNVEALQVVTGEGRIVTCSECEQPELFNAVLAGQGQCAVIVRAVIKLVDAPARVRAFSMLYADLTTALSDADRLIDEKRFDGVVVFTFAQADGSHGVVLRCTKYYSPPTVVDDEAMLAGLNFVPGVKQIDDLTYLQNFSITTGPFPPLPHPAFTTVLPASAATQYLQGVLPRLNASDLGTYGATQIFPWRSKRFKQPLMRIPTEQKLVGFAIIRYAANAADLERMVQANRRLFEESRAVGGTLYPFSAVQLSDTDWKQHYGEHFAILATAKQCFDPANVLASGPDMF